MLRRGFCMTCRPGAKRICESHAESTDRLTIGYGYPAVNGLSVVLSFGSFFYQSVLECMTAFQSNALSRNHGDCGKCFLLRPRAVVTSGASQHLLWLTISPCARVVWHTAAMGQRAKELIVAMAFVV